MRLASLEARGPGTAAPAKAAAPARKLSPEEAAKAAAQREAEEISIGRCALPCAAQPACSTCKPCIGAR